MANLMVEMPFGSYDVAEENIVKVSGTTVNTGKSAVSRKVQIYDSGTSNMRDEIDSNSSDGFYQFFLIGVTSDKFRLEAFAFLSEPDENSQVFDFVNPEQITTIL